MSVSMVVNVTPLALQTVRKTSVTYRMDRVLTVILDGLEHIVKHVRGALACFVI